MTLQQFAQKLGEAAGPDPDEEIRFAVWKCINYALDSKTKRFDKEHPIDRCVTVAATMLLLSKEDGANVEAAKEALWNCRDKLDALNRAIRSGGEYPAASWNKLNMRLSEMILVAYIRLLSKTKTTEVVEQVIQPDLSPSQLAHIRLHIGKVKAAALIEPYSIQIRRRKPPTVKEIREEIHIVADRKISVADSTIRYVIKHAGFSLNRPGQPRKN